MNFLTFWRHSSSCVDCFIQGLYIYVVVSLILAVIGPQVLHARPNHNCEKDEIALRREGTVHCVDLTKCHVEYGLNFPFKHSQIYPYDMKRQCSGCEEGKTFSDTEGYEQCKNCTRCQDHELFTGKCTRGKDEIKCLGKCEEIYFWLNSTKSCVSCSSCCQYAINSSCLVKCSLTKDNCTLSANSTKAPNATNTIPTPRTTIITAIPTQTPDKSQTVTIIVIVLVAVIIGAVICFKFRRFLYSCICCICRKLYHPGRSDQQGPDVSVASSDTIESLTPLQDGQKTSVEDIVTVPLNWTDPSGDVSASLDQDCTRYNIGNDATITQGSQEKIIYVMKKDDADLSQVDVIIQKVEDIPSEEQQQICAILDKEHPFFKDKRMFAEYLVDKQVLDLTKEVINKNNSQFIIGKIQDLSIETLLEALEWIEKKNEVINILKIRRVRPLYSDPQRIQCKRYNCCV